MFTRIFLFLFWMGASGNLLAQDDDLLKDVANDKPAKTSVGSAFKSSRVIMSQSIEMLKPGVLDFRILHRFGTVNQGAKEFFGLDQATIRLGFDYGISRNLTIGIGRGSYRKELDGFIKGKLLHQQVNGMPLSLVLVGGSTLITVPWAIDNEKYRFGHRVAYLGQLVAGRKFSEAFSLQLMPTFLHRNLVPTPADRNNLFAAGVGGRLKVSKRSSINFDYYLVEGKGAGRYNPLSIGVDIETGGHVFQLHLTNAVGMNERVFLTETTNSWGKGDIQIGFNISRAFQVGGRR